MTGHCSPEEVQRISELESKLKEGCATEEEMTRLARMYMCPAHRLEDALELFEQIVERNEKNAWARYWLAECYVHEVMTGEALRRGKELLDLPEVSDSSWRAASLGLLAHVLESLNEVDEEGALRLREDAVDARPDWASNHYLLGRQYESLGRIPDAIRELEKAADNLIADTSDLDAWTLDFEVSVTGRAADDLPTEIPKRLARLKGRTQQG